LWQSATARQHQLQQFVLLRDTGRLKELTDEIALPSPVNLWRVATQAHRMWLALERGQLSAARADYDALVADDFTNVPFDANWFGVMIPLTEAAIAFDDAPRMRRICDLLAPYQSRLASVVILGVVHGPVALTLGRLALALDESEIAVEYLAYALQLAEAGDMQPYVARALVGLGEATLQRGSARDRDEAYAFTRRAAGVAGAIGMEGLVPRNEDLLAVFKAQRATQFGLTARELDVLRLVAEGLTDQEVAGRLFLSPRTVGAHLTSIYTRLNVASRTAAARIALEHRLV
jgi:DNA-binding NarL/FixJ family response regulator